MWVYPCSFIARGLVIPLKGRHSVFLTHLWPFALKFVVATPWTKESHNRLAWPSSEQKAPRGIRSPLFIRVRTGIFFDPLTRRFPFSPFKETTLPWRIEKGSLFPRAYPPVFRTVNFEPVSLFLSPVHPRSMG